MVRVFIFLGLILSNHFLFSQTVVNTPPGEKILEIISWKKKVFVVTDKNIFVLKNKFFLKIYNSEKKILSAVASENNFFMLTENSIETFKGDLMIKTQSIPLNETLSKSVIGLRSDSAKRNIYLVTHDEGIFQVSESGLKNFLMPNNVNDAYFNNERDYWLGTQSGLGHQIGNRYLRYVEESITGYSLPDNLVEHLHRTPDNRLIVQMAEAVTILNLAGERTEGHGTDLGFIGQKGNDIYDICGLLNGFTLFATQNGLILAGKNALAQEPDGGLKEVYSPENRKAYRLKPQELGLGTDKNIRILRAIFDEKKWVYLATEKAIVILDVKKIIE